MESAAPPPAGNANLQIGSSAIGHEPIACAPFWHSRGYLPHFEHAGATQHITFHLADSLPAEIVRRWKRRCGAFHPRSRTWNVASGSNCGSTPGHGSCVLREPEVARMVEGAFQFFDGQRYRLLAWVVMPNHVHVLLEQMPGWTVAE